MGLRPLPNPWVSRAPGAWPVHLHTHVYTERRAHPCGHTHMYTYAHRDVHMRVYTQRLDSCALMYIHTEPCTCMCTHVRLHTPTQTDTRVHTCTYTSAGVPCPETRHNPAAPGRTSRGADAVMAILATFRAAQNLWEDTSGPHKSSGADTYNNKEKPGDPGHIDFLFCFAPREGHLPVGRAGRNYVLSPLQGASALTR